PRRRRRSSPGICRSLPRRPSGRPFWCATSSPSAGAASSTDPHNFGAVLRIADAAGVDGIIYRKTRSVKLNATVVRVSTGAAFYVKCVEAVNLTAAIKNLKSFGYWIVGAEAATESIDFRSIKYDMATALVIGSEGRGLSRLVKDNCDYLVQIPMFGHINSLNAAVAAGVLTYHIKGDQN
ncbi:MAG: 23S rRNA (guanosine(2251)-2'-O)-methyltransferase RlmB, partial [Bacilli bacterium]|nr:23S rRNA (guanosine(2251)-2'-O)-methyltransferase RlmB [Bacilli bacterium]